MQIAKLLGAHVTAVCSGRNVEMVRSLGADEVVDYTTEDITQMGLEFDRILDNAGSIGARKLSAMLEPEGRVALITGPKEGKIFGPVGHIARTKLWFAFGNRTAGVLNAESRAEDFAQLGEWVASGDITPVIHRTFPLEGAPEAMELIGTGHAPAKLVDQPVIAPATSGSTVTGWPSPTPIHARCCRR